MTQAVIQTTVTGMQGRPIATTVPTANQAYTWSGSAWVPTGPYLPTAGGILTGTLRYQYGTPQNIFNDTTQSITAGGLWRESNSGGSFLIQSNTATAGDFSTSTTPLTLNANGTVNIGNNASVAGAFSASGNMAAGGTLTVTGNTLFQGALNSVQSGRIVSSNAGNNPGFCCWNTQSTGYTWVMYQDAGFNLSWTTGVSTGAPGGANLMTLTSNGNLSIAGVLSQGSDERTKSNISVYAPGVSIVTQLLPKTYTYTGDETGTLHLGFMAQDVQPLIPTAVSGTQETTFGLDTTPIIAAVVNAVKQLISRVQALESHDNITPTAAETA